MGLGFVIQVKQQHELDPGPRTLLPKPQAGDGEVGLHPRTSVALSDTPGQLGGASKGGCSRRSCPGSLPGQDGVVAPGLWSEVGGRGGSGGGGGGSGGGGGGEPPFLSRTHFIPLDFCVCRGQPFNGGPLYQARWIDTAPSPN